MVGRAMIGTVVFASFGFGAGAGQTPGPPPITISAGLILDGRGGSIRNGTVVIEGGKILRVEPRLVDRPTLAFPTSTLLPGLIDVHAHPASYQRNDRLRAPGDGEPASISTLAAVDNLGRTLRAGFTTIQSLGAATDLDLRAAVTDGGVVGPRLLTSLNPITDPSLSADSLRALVRLRAANGADAIKLFASRGLGEGGAPTMSEEQLTAICGEAKARGLRSVVHAHSSESIRRAVTAGCTEIEHGVFADQSVLDLMAARGTYFDPQCGSVFENYLEHRMNWFAGGSYATPEGKALLERGLSLGAAVTKAAAATKGLKLIYGTDAVAVGNGRNGDDLVCRVNRAGLSPMAAIVTATSASAEALGLGREIGAVAPGFVADLIVVAGDPTKDVTMLGRVGLVIRAGRIVHYDPQQIRGS